MDSSLVVALVGVGGTLGGVGLTQWVAGRRAREEREASELREERQRAFLHQSTEVTLAREDLHRVTDQRREAYARLSAALSRWQDALGGPRAGRQAVNRMPTAGEKEAVQDAENEAREAVSYVDLFGSKPVRGATRSTWVALSFAGHTVKLDDSTSDDIEKAFDRAWRAYWRLLDFMRIDLGVDPEAPESAAEYAQRMSAPEKDGTAP